MKMNIEFDMNRLDDDDSKCHEFKTVNIYITDDDMKHCESDHNIVDFALHTLKRITSYDTMFNTLDIRVFHNNAQIFDDRLSLTT